MNVQEFFKGFIAGVLIIGGIIFAAWLSLFYLLYGGIMQAINSWGVSNTDVVWGIIKAVFFECGLIPGYLAVLLGIAALEDLIRESCWADEQFPQEEELSPDIPNDVPIDGECEK